MSIDISAQSGVTRSFMRSRDARRHSRHLLTVSVASVRPSSDVSHDLSKPSHNRSSASDSVDKDKSSSGWESLASVHCTSTNMMYTMMQPASTRQFELFTILKQNKSRENDSTWPCERRGVCLYILITVCQKDGRGSLRRPLAKDSGH